jgi:putative redox protein
METVKIIYLGDMRTEATHVKSGNKLITDAPVDNLGKGEFFSPTDLLATALATCAMTIIGQAAHSHSFSVEGTKIHVTKIMEQNPRRVGEVVIIFDFPPVAYSEKEKQIIRHSAATCPVLLSVHPDLKKTFIFNFPE